MLVEEVEKRLATPLDGRPTPGPASGLRSSSSVRLLSSIDVLPEPGLPDARLPGFDAAEGYRLRVVDAKPPIVIVAGNDSRGVLFGVGRLLRELRISSGGSSSRAF